MYSNSQLGSEVVKRLLNHNSSGKFKTTSSNAEVVKSICEAFIRILQEQAEKEHEELNQLRKLYNRRARKTIGNSVYIKLAERLFKQGWSNFQLGVSAQDSRDTDISREKEVIA